MQKEILSSGPIAKMAFFFLYCFITPLLEETVYRGFLLTSLCSSKMKWQQAVILSSFIFSLAHFSSDSSPQLFVIGCVLGCSYCWSGNLLSSLTIHALYNALTLIVTILSWNKVKFLRRSSLRLFRFLNSGSFFDLCSGSKLSRMGTTYIIKPVPAPVPNILV